MKMPAWLNAVRTGTLRQRPLLEEWPLIFWESVARLSIVILSVVEGCSEGGSGLGNYYHSPWP